MSAPVPCREISGVHARIGGIMTRSRLETIHGIAAAQEGVITRQQLLQAGMSTHSIERRRRNGTLRPVHIGVYQLGPVAGRFAREHAALLACGGGAISNFTAASLWQLIRAVLALDVDVTLPQSRHTRRRKGVRVHRHSLADDEITLLDGLPVTTPARTLLDLAALTTDGLDRALATAEHRYPDIQDELRTLLARYPLRKGTRALRALIMDPAARAFTRSTAEDRLLDLIKSAGLPTPETNVRIGSYEVDCYWRRAALVAEVDGYEFHASKRAFVRDRKRDSALAAAGIRVLRLSWQQLTKDRDRTLVELALALGRASV